VYRIRFHGRGGQGMKTAGRILGTAFFLEGYEVQDAPRYGAERRGAPIFAYVRASRGAIRERGIIGKPDLIVVADETLLQIPAAGVPSGAEKKTVMLLCTAERAEVWRRRLNFPGPLIVLTAPSEGEGLHENRSISSACAGAAARLVGPVSKEALKEAVSLELAGLGGAVVDRNRHVALECYELMAAHEGLVAEAVELPPGACEKPKWIDLPFEDARTSAPVIHAAATSTLVKTGLWRTMRPVIDYGHCKGCWWVCSTFCPDGAITVTDDGTPRVDYDHCKGCMICVTQCTAHAIRAVSEHEAEHAQDQGGVS
jgi:pyruvate ferredoxin oxidoreductase gamma subunit